MWASKKLGRPVKWVATRTDSMLTDHHGRDMVLYGELALDENGKIVGLRARCLFNVGAYFVGAASRPAPSRCASCRRPTTTRPCSSPRQGLFTNTAPIGPYRGAGRPEAAYFTERLIEHAARQIGIGSGRNPPPQSDPAEQAALHDADLLDL